MPRSVRLTALAILLSAVHAADAAQAPNFEPCKLLTDAEVRAVFPGASSGVRNRSVDEYGIVSCVWTHPGGRFAIQAQTSSVAPEAQARSYASGSLDPFKAGLEQKVRVDKIAVGDGGVAIVERQDAKQGVLADASVAVVKRGPLLLMLQSDSLPQRPRPDAIKALEGLATAAVKRLP